uniref:Uncharacterized protein n=1 Tax=Plectus sambesii TaxID=2011161 RepID=A0A914VAS4_9BILA
MAALEGGDSSAAEDDRRRQPADTQSAPGDLAVFNCRPPPSTKSPTTKSPATKAHLAATLAHAAKDLPDIEILDPDQLGVDPASLQTQCGISWYRPKCLQRFATKNWMLFWMCWYCTVQGLLVNGLVPSSISTIERRFQMSMSTIGRVMQVGIFVSFGLLVSRTSAQVVLGGYTLMLFIAKRRREIRAPCLAVGVVP